MNTNARMPFDIADVVTRGYERTVARNGLVFVGLFYLLSLLEGLFSVDPDRQTVPPDQVGIPAVEPAVGAQPYAPSLGLSPLVAGALSLLLGLVSVVVTVAALRTFVSDETERIPRRYYTHNLPWAILNVFVGGLVFAFALAIGFLLLILPGLFLLVALFFWQVFVVVEDQNFVEGFRNSWGLTRGHRIRLFALGVVVFVVAAVVSLAFGIPGIVLPDVVGFLLAQLGSAFVGVFYLATTARAYTQLVGTADAAAPPEDQPVR